MKLLFIPALLISISSFGQLNSTAFVSPRPLQREGISNNSILHEQIKITRNTRWRLDRNKLITGGLLFTAGFSKGFNEALQFKYNGFEDIFPHANDQWFYPTFSYTNKFKDHDPEKGARFPLSTSVLVMFTDQYHLNNFIQKTALTAALVIKIGEGKKPLKHYLMDIAYYTICYQVGFHSVYTPISMRN